MPIGDIGDSIEQYEFEDTYGRHPALEYVRPNLYCVAFEKAGHQTRVQTYFISDAGVITTPAEDTLDLLTGAWDYNQSCRRPDQNIVLVNSGFAANLYLEAVKVADDGALSQHANHGCFLEPFDSWWFNVVYQRDSIIVIFCRHSNHKPHVITNVVTDAAAVSDPLEDWFKVEDLDGGHVQGIRISEGVALIAYHRLTVDIYARPLRISSDGTISGLAQATTQISNIDGSPERLIHLTADWFILSISGPLTNLNLCAFQCAADGTITVPANNSYVVYAGRGIAPQINKLTDNMISIFSRDADENAWLHTVHITLTDPVAWSLHASKLIGPGITQPWGSLVVSSGVLLLSYADAGNHAWLWTYEVQTQEPTRPDHSLTLGIAP